MSATRIVCIGAVALLAAGQVAALPAERRAAIWTGLSTILGSRAAPAAVAPPVAQAFEPRLTTAMLPRGPSRPGTLIVPPDAGGQFNAVAEVDGVRFPVLIDTGATVVCLTFEDADRLGLRPAPSDFRYGVGTANGRVAYARTELQELRLGNLAVRQVTALIAPRGALGRTLLGMNFLSRLGGYRVDAGRLVLEP